MKEAADHEYSFVICAFKCLLDVNPTTSILAPMLDVLATRPSTTIVLLQNGIGIEDDLQADLERRGCHNLIISGCAWTDTTLVNGGKTVVQHGNERLVLGYHKPKTQTNDGGFSDSEAQAKLDSISDLFRQGGAHVDQADIDVARWRKVLWYVISSWAHSLRSILRV